MACRGLPQGLRPASFVFALVLGSATQSAALSFVDVTASAGVDYLQQTYREPENCRMPLLAPPPAFWPDINCSVERFSGAVAIGDADGDGLDDIFVTRLDDRDLLFRNLGDGTFDEIGVASGLGLVADTNAALWVDIDNDGDEDLYITTVGLTRNYLYENDGTGTFVEVALASDAASANSAAHGGSSIGAGDFDRDGDLDLYASEWRSFHNAEINAPSNNIFLVNRGPTELGLFDDETASAGVSMIGFHDAGELSFSPSFADLDDDGWPDLQIVADGGSSQLFWNNADGTFTNGTVAAGVGTDENGMGSTFGDYDGDGDLDWFISSIYCPLFPDQVNCTGNRLYRNDGSRVFTDVTDAAGVRDGAWGWGTAFGDFDNDGDLDLVQANGYDLPLSSFDDLNHEDQTRYWENVGGTFTETATAVGIDDTNLGHGLAVFDFDSDGDLDIFVVNGGSHPILYRNDLNSGAAWLRVRAEGAPGGTNSKGSGAIVRAAAVQGGSFQVRQMGVASHFQGQSEQVAHFGFGSHSGPIARVEIEWPRSGTVSVLSDVAADSVITVKECDDSIECTLDTFVEGTGCVHTPQNQSCDDGLFCNGAETCSTATGCVSAAPPDCSHLDTECSSAVCDEATDICTTVDAPAGWPCDDQLFCTTGDSCSDGVCSGVARDCSDTADCTVDSCDEESDACIRFTDDSACDDQNPCTNDVCLVNVGCSNVANEAPCDDGLFCTVDDRCSDSICSGSPNFCDDGLSCTDDSCDEDTDSCQSSPDNSACDDGAHCNGIETCNPATGCTSGTAVDCSHLNATCQAGLCSETEDQCESVAANHSAPCDDGLASTENDRCVAGECMGDTIVCDDGIACTVDAFNLELTACEHTPVDSLCWDGLFCNGAETCSADSGCQSGEASDCSNLDGPCTTGICNEELDLCEAVAANETVSCDDGLFCTVNDRCIAGVCTGELRSCDDGVACTTDTCSEGAATCAHAPANSACDDGLFCNGEEICNADTGCASGMAPCFALDCSLTCNEVADVCETVVGEPCDDANACTVGEHCDGFGSCQAGSPLVCDDNSTCTQDRCDIQTGCVFETEPPPGCEPLSGLLAIKKGTTAKLSWKASRATIDPAGLASLGTAESRGVHLCLYENAAGGLDHRIAWSSFLPGDEDCGSGPCWLGRGDPISRWQYRDKAALFGDVSNVYIQGGRPGRDKTKLKASGDGSRLTSSSPNSIFAPDSGVSFSLVSGDSGACWTMSLSPEDISRSTDRAFKAKN